MIHYQVTHFNYIQVDDKTPPLHKHWILVYECTDGFHRIWRGTQNEIKKITKNTNDCLVNVVGNVDCVWNFSIDSKHIITLVGIKIYNNHDIQSIIDREIDRVINFDDNYTTTNL
nr:unknown [Pieris rapae granulovirus]